MNNTIKQLVQFIDGPVWDGNIIGKETRDSLWKNGYIERDSGFSFLTAKGVRICAELNLIKV